MSLCHVLVTAHVLVRDAEEGYWADLWKDPVFPSPTAGLPSSADLPDDVFSACDDFPMCDAFPGLLGPLTQGRVSSIRGRSALRWLL